jgi:tetratricopeptide (TPR) repeat protein/transcriptional regulator with XRE-family HTH domain
MILNNRAAPYFTTRYIGKEKERDMQGYFFSHLDHLSLLESKGKMFKMKSMKSIPNRLLKEARELRGWSQQYVAERIDAPASCYISRWERGVTFPSPYYREKLCTLFGADARALGFFQSQSDTDARDFTSQNGQQHIEDHVPQSQTFTRWLANDHAMLSEHIPLLTISPPSLPGTQSSDLIGRTSLISRFKQRLCASKGGESLAFYGLPGIGKTSLALALTHEEEVQRCFHDGILWSAVGPHPNIAELLARWGRSLGITSPETESSPDSRTWAESIRDAIGMRKILLVIDDVWRFEDALAFKVGGPHCTYLITTRAPEIALFFANYDATAINELDEQESLLLLSRFVPEVVEQEPQATRALVQSVGGLPLALTIVGKHLRVQAYSGQPRRIQSALKRLLNGEERIRLAEQTPLERSSGASTDTPISLQAVIETSDRQLEPDLRSAFSALSILPAKPYSFSERAALAVADIQPEALDRLTDAGLLEGCGPGRYAIHQIIADYARVVLKDATVYDRLVAYVKKYVKQYATDHSKLEEELPTILAGLETAFEREKKAELVQTICILAPFLHLLSSHLLIKRHVWRAYQAAISLDDLPSALTCLLHVGDSERKQGAYARAADLYQQGLRLARQLDDSQQICFLLSHMGDIAIAQGNYTQAEAYTQGSLKLARQFHDQQQVIHLLSNLGRLATKRGHLDRAERYFHEGLEKARSMGLQEKVSYLLTYAGWVAAERGHYTQAETYLQEGLKIARQLNIQDTICHLLINLGRAMVDMGDYIRAQTYLQEGLEVARQLDIREATSEVLYILGILAIMQGNLSRASVYVQEGLALACQIGHRERISRHFIALGAIAIAQENYAQARRHVLEGLALARHIGDRTCIGEALLQLGRLAIRQEEPLQAETYLQESLTLARQIGKCYSICAVLYMMGEAHLLLQKIAGADYCFRELQQNVPQVCPEMAAKASYGLARVTAAYGDINEASKQGQMSLHTLENIGHDSAREVRAWLIALSSEDATKAG